MPRHASRNRRDRHARPAPDPAPPPPRASGRAPAREHTQDPEGQESIFGPLLAKSRAAKAGATGAHKAIAEPAPAREVNAASGTISTEGNNGAVRRAPRTVPPPPPGKKVGSTSGSVAAVVPASSGSALERMPLPADVTDVSARPSAVPPPIPAARPVPRIDFVTPDDSETFVEDGPPGAMPALAVPVGEFDHGGFAGTEIEADKLRVQFEQSTMKRDAANAILGLPEPALTAVRATPVEVLLGETAAHLRGDPTLESPSTGRFERADPTHGDRGDNTKVPASSGTGVPSGTLRTSATLRRKRGLGGDLRYVATAIAGVRRARRELALLESRQALRTQSRERHLVTLGRAAVMLERFDHPALGPAREQLGEVEEERSQHAGQVAAADSELLRVRRDREARAKQYALDLTALDAELVDATTKLEPLEKEQARVTRRTTEMRDAIRRIDSQLAATEASLSSIKAAKQDKAGIEAELATLRADRQAIMRDEPKIATELDALSPRIAALEARRSDARKRRIELEQAEQQDQRRAEELLAAIGAKRKVVDRAAGDAETLRDKILFGLGERLYVDRPTDLGPQLAPIDVIDMELGTGDRRAMELREILSSIDKAKLARGIAVLLVLLAIIGAIGWLVLSVAL